MCGCLFAFFAAGFPRIGLGLVWLFTDMVNKAFDGAFIPMMGMIFLPFTTLIYVFLYTPMGLAGIDWFFLAFAFFLDIGSYVGTGITNKR